MRQILVVARWTEDVSWTQTAPWEVDIIQKQTDDLKGDMPNVGREPTSYLFAIYKHYPSLKNEDVMAFVQGNPFDHTPDLYKRLAKPTDSFSWLGKGTFVTDGNGAPHDHQIPVKEMYEKWTGKEFPGGVSFCPGGMFMVTGKVIKKHPREYYSELLDDCTVQRNCYAYERLAESVFTL